LNRKYRLGLAAALALAALTAGVAFAHPSLVRSDPPANATLAEPPARVTVWFDEAIEPEYGHLEVFDAQGRRVDNLNTQYQPGAEPALTVSLPALPQGTYIVVWRVISAGDAHAVGGAFSFGVGVPPDPSAAASAGAQASAAPDLTSHLLRYLSLFGQAVLIGAVIFRALVQQPVMAALAPAERDAVQRDQHRLLTVLADVLRAALIIGVLGVLYVQARVAGVYFWELFPTRWGAIWIVRAVTVFLAAGWMESLLEDHRRVRLGLGLSAVLLITTTLTSHSAAKPGIVGPLADAAHLLSTSAWAGGLLLLGLSLPTLSALDPALRARAASEMVARFSGVAAASVGALVASGAVLSAGQVKTWAGLLLTPYGQTLLVKLLIAAGAFGLGVYNSLVTRRRLAAHTEGRAAWWIAGEASLSTIVIFAAAVLTNLPPAAAQSAATADTALEFAVPADDLQIAGRVRPARLGSNAFEITPTTAAGAPVRGAQIELFFQPVGGGALSSRLSLAEAAGGSYAAAGNTLTREGPWQILVTIQRGGAATVYASVALEIGPDAAARLAGEPLPALARMVGWLNRFGAPALAGLILAVAAGWSAVTWQALAGLRRAPAWWLVAGLLLAALLWFLIVLR
jgi:copper transport protein